MTKNAAWPNPPYTEPVETEFTEFNGRRIITTVWWGDKYPLEYLLRLKRSIDRNMTLPYAFQVITDHSWFGLEDLHTELAGTRWVGSVDGWPGWWQKVGAFDKDLYDEGERVMLVDLDLVITGRLEGFFCSAHHTSAIANFGVNYRHSKYNSSLVVWDAHGPAQAVYDQFRERGPEDIITGLHGDQCWFWRVMLDDVRVWPDGWCQSYKYDVRRQGLHRNCRAVIFHGKPDPDEVGDPFVKENWR